MGSQWETRGNQWETGGKPVGNRWESSVKPGDTSGKQGENKGNQWEARGNQWETRGNQWESGGKPGETNGKPSLSIFKSNVLKLIRPQKKNVFNIHDPEGTKRLFQLRVGLSPLRYHKKRHNFKDCPSDTCICGMSVETTEHFLIYCNLYNEVRVNLFQVINPYIRV